jgi:hypothetical protein
MMNARASKRTLRARDHWMRAARLALLAGLAGLLTAGCASGPPPLFEGARPVGAQMLLFAPEVRLGGRDAARDNILVGGVLERELRSAFVGHGVSIDRAPNDDDAERLRKAVLVALDEQRVRNRRLRVDNTLPLQASLTDVAVPLGSRAVAVALMVRSGVVTDGRTYLPRPADEIVELPEERGDYEIPNADDYANSSVGLDLIVLEVPSGRVKLHRRVSEPVQTLVEIQQALPALVREATRGVEP